MPPEIERKALNVEFKADEEGNFRAKFATFNVIDKEKDVTLSTAMPLGKSVIVSPFEHQSVLGPSNTLLPPVGKAIVQANNTKAWAEGQFFLKTTAGREAYERVKAMGDLQQWSYGYIVLDQSVDAKSLAAYPGARRVLKSLDVIELSPVTEGAGIDTQTEYVKSLRSISLPYTEHSDLMLDLLAEWIDRSKSRADFREQKSRTLSTADREKIGAFVKSLQELLDGKADGNESPSPDAELDAIWLAVERRQAELRASELMRI